MKTRIEKLIDKAIFLSSVVGAVLVFVAFLIGIYFLDHIRFIIPL